MKIIQLGIVFLMIFPWNLRGQPVDLEVFASSGSNAGMYDSWTIGEVFTMTLNNSSNIISEGFHQPITTITSVAEVPIDLSARLFPNPTSGRTTLDLSGSWTGKIHLTLTSLMGQVLMKKSEILPLERIEFDLSHLSDGMYLLTLSTADQKLITYFRIEKIN